MGGQQSGAQRGDDDQNADPPVGVPRLAVGTISAAAVCHYDAV
jgi:hypothetical protein